MIESKKLIFMVDDNRANLRVGVNILGDQYAIATAPSAEKMFSLLEKNKPDLILLDVEMPVMSGYEAIQILKGRPETKDIPVIFLTNKTDLDFELKGLSLGAIDYIAKPFQPLLLLKRIEVHLLVEEQRKTLAIQAAELKRFNENLLAMVNEKTRNVIVLQDALLQTVAELLEYRDVVTGFHTERTKKGVRILVDEIKKRNWFVEESQNWDNDLLVLSSQLHDVGKISISDHILKKPAPLNDEEFEEMKKHCSFGEEIIDRIEALAEECDFLKYAKIFAASHHERWDGEGYPKNLKKDEIPLLGRIMAIVDVYDALISSRPYKESLTHEEAVQIIAQNSGTQFDPAVVDVFVRAADRFVSPTLP